MTRAVTGAIYCVLTWRKHCAKGSVCHLLNRTTAVRGGTAMSVSHTRTLGLGEIEQFG